MASHDAANHDPGSDHGHGDHADDHHEHGISVAQIGSVFLALFVLTLISFAVANSWLMQTKAVGWLLMMAVSCAKAMLVISFFMHLKWEANWKYVLTIPASIMSIFLVLMLVPDVGSRTSHYSSERWRHSAHPGEAEHHESGDTHEGEAEEH